jgi:hypothetical protein
VEGAADAAEDEATLEKHLRHASFDPVTLKSAEILQKYVHVV